MKLSAKSGEREDVRRERLTCLVRFLLVPEAMRDTISGEDFFYRLASPVLPPLTGLTRRHEDTKDAKAKAGNSDKAGDHKGRPYNNRRRRSEGRMPSLPGGRSREEGEITCRVRSPFVPEAKGKKNIWQGFLLTSHVLPSLLPFL